MSCSAGGEGDAESGGNRKCGTKESELDIDKSSTGIEETEAVEETVSAERSSSEDTDDKKDDSHDDNETSPAMADIPKIPDIWTDDDGNRHINMSSQAGLDMSQIEIETYIDRQMRKNYDLVPLYIRVFVNNLEEHVDYFKSISDMKEIRTREYKTTRVDERGERELTFKGILLAYTCEFIHYGIEFVGNVGHEVLPQGKLLSGVVFSNYEAYRETCNQFKNEEIDKTSGIVKVMYDDIRILSQRPAYSSLYIPEGEAPIKFVTIICTNLERSCEFYEKKMKFRAEVRTKTTAAFACGLDGSRIQLYENKKLFRKGALPLRLYFAMWPKVRPFYMKHTAQMGAYPVDSDFYSAKPAKNDLEELVYRDPDGHEICFVNAKNYREEFEVSDAEDDYKYERKSLKKFEHGRWGSKRRRRRRAAADGSGGPAEGEKEMYRRRSFSDSSFSSPDEYPGKYGDDSRKRYSDSESEIDRRSNPKNSDSSDSDECEEKAEKQKCEGGSAGKQEEEAIQEEEVDK